MDKPEWFEQIEQRLLVRNFLQNEYALQPSDTDSAVKNATLFAEVSQKAMDLEKAFEKSEKERKMLIERVRELEEGNDNIYEVRKERDELRNEVKKLKENYQSKEFKYYVEQVKLQNMVKDLQKQIEDLNKKKGN